MQRGQSHASRYGPFMSGLHEALGFRWYLAISFLLSAGFGLLLAHLAINAAIEQAHFVVLRDLEDEAALRAAQSVLAEQHKTIRAFISASVLIGLMAAFGLIYRLGRRMILAPLTALRRSEARLRDSERRARRLAMVAEQTTDLVIIYDADRMISWVNSAFERVTGYKLREVRGKQPADFLNGPRSDQQTTRRIADAMERGEGVSAQIVNYSKTGREYLVELSIAPVLDEDGQIANFIAVERDISDRDRAQRRLQEALEAIENPICVFDEREVLVAFNEAYRKFGSRYGVKARDGATLTTLIGQAVDGGMFDATGRGRDAAIAARLAEWRTAQRAEKIIEYGDGASVLLREVRTTSGDTVSVRTDVTELTEARRKAEAATDAKSRFLAAISHEVRTPMNGVITMAELLLESKVTQDQRAGLELISQSGQSLVTIINDILDFSKLEAGKMTIRPEPFDLVDGVEEVCALLAPTAAERGLECAFDFDPEAPRFFVGDMGRIRQIVTNLMGNAIKFTGTGSVRVRVTARAAGDMAEVAIEVIDTGVGISESELESVFAPFEQAENAGAVRLQEGTGLGLSISRQLASIMGGEVTAMSKPGVGSTFTLSLRLPIDASMEIAKTLSGKRVLLAGAEAQQALRAAQVAALGGRVIDGVAANLSPPDLVIAALGEDGRPPAIASVYGDTPVILVAPVLGAGAPNLSEAPTVRLLRRPVRQAMLSRVATEFFGDDAKITDPNAKRPVRDDPPHTSRIVVVEDNKTNAAIFQAVLGAVADEVSVFPTGGAGLRAIAADVPDLVIMDLNLPDMSGLDAMRCIRKREAAAARPRTPVIAATASASEDDRRACFEAGADDFVLKPLDPKRLREVVEQWLRHDADAVQVNTLPGAGLRETG